MSAVKPKPRYGWPLTQIAAGDKVKGRKRSPIPEHYRGAVHAVNHDGSLYIIWSNGANSVNSPTDVERV